MIQISVPPPPSTNALYTGRRFKTARYKAWIKEAGWTVKLAAPQTIKGPVKMLITLSGMRHDIDNIKALLDLCQTMGLIENDSLVDDLHIRRSGSPGQQVYISIWPLRIASEAAE